MKRAILRGLLGALGYASFGTLLSIGFGIPFAEAVPLIALFTLSLGGVFFADGAP